MRSGAALTMALSIVIAFGLGPVRIEMKLRPRLPVGMTIGAATAISLWAVARGLGAPPAVAISAGLLTAPLPVSLRQASVRRTAMREASRWPDFIAAVRSRIATGASLPEATRAAARHLGGRFVELDRGPGEPFSVTLRRVQNDRADPLTDRIVTTLTIAAEAGGRHVDAVLATLAASVGDELRLRRAHDAALTQQRLTAGIALVAPWAMLALSIATNPTAAHSYASPTGTWIVLGGLVATVAGFLLARRAARLSEPPRVFS